MFQPSVLSLLTLPSACTARYYNWSTAAPVMLAMQVYQKPLPQVKEKNSLILSRVKSLSNVIDNKLK